MLARGNLIGAACLLLGITLLAWFLVRPPVQGGELLDPARGAQRRLQKPAPQGFKGDGMAEQPQKVSALNELDVKRLAAQRQIIEQHLSDESRKKYQSAAGKLGTLRALLDAKVFEAAQTYELQSMGIVLGDVFVQDMGFHWVMVEDDYGRDPALQYRDTSIILFPLTMISKRVERGEAVEVSIRRFQMVDS